MSLKFLIVKMPQLGKKTPKIICLQSCIFPVTVKTIKASKTNKTKKKTRKQNQIQPNIDKRVHEQKSPYRFGQLMCL